MLGYKIAIYVLLLVVVGMLQHIIHSAALQSLTADGIINYWSFVGTAISIVLAIVAIVYTFLQNSAQNYDKNSISEKISIMEFILKDMKVAVAGVSSIQDILDNVTRLKSSSVRHGEQLCELHKKFDMYKYVVEIKNDAVHIQSDNKPQCEDCTVRIDWDVIVDRFPNVGKAFLIMLYATRDCLVDFGERCNRCFITKVHFVADCSGQDGSFSCGYCVGVAVALAAWGALLNFKPESYELSDDFCDSIEKMLEKDTEKNMFKQYLNMIQEELKNFEKKQT